MNILSDRTRLGFPVFAVLAAGMLTAACDNDSGPTEPPIPPGYVEVNLAPGEELVVTDPGVVNRLVLPAAAAGT